LLDSLLQEFQRWDQFRDNCSEAVIIYGNNRAAVYFA